MLRLKNVGKRFGRFQLSDISLDVAPGECVVLVGPSGAGKSVLLELVAGFRTVDHGSIELDGRDLTREEIQRRGIGYIPQHSVLFPHLSVWKNIAYGLAGVVRSEQSRRVEAIAEEMGVKHLLEREPETLSGGEAQRVSLARILVTHPRILLLDEALRSLDSHAQEDLRSVLRALHWKGLSLLHVTHDEEEARFLADRVVRLESGRVVQEGPVQTVLPPKAGAIYLPRSILIGGTTRDAGKTEFTCRLIRHFSSATPIEAVKVTVHHTEKDGAPGKEKLEHPFSIVEEKDPAREKDTGRMLAAGARRVFWLRVKEHALRDGLCALLEQLSPDARYVFESNSARRVLEPDLFLMVSRKPAPPRSEIKPTARAVLGLADRLVGSDGATFDLPMEELRLKNGRWSLSEGRKHGSAVVG